MYLISADGQRHEASSIVYVIELPSLDPDPLARSWSFSVLPGFELFTFHDKGNDNRWCQSDADIDGYGWDTAPLLFVTLNGNISIV